MHDKQTRIWKEKKNNTRRRRKMISRRKGVEQKEVENKKNHEGKE